MRYRLTPQELADLREAALLPGPTIIAGEKCDLAMNATIDIWNRVAERVGCRVDTIGPAGEDVEWFEAEAVAQ